MWVVEGIFENVCTSVTIDPSSVKHTSFSLSVTLSALPTLSLALTFSLILLHPAFHCPVSSVEALEISTPPPHANSHRYRLLQLSRIRSAFALRQRTL